MRPLAALLSLFLTLLPFAAYGDTLKGGIEEEGITPSTQPGAVAPMPMPVVPSLQGQTASTGAPSSMTGAAQKDALNGRADQNGEGQFGAMQPKSDNSGVLKAGAQISDLSVEGGDPDQQDQELQVEWDRWRNRLLYAIQSGVQDDLNNPNETMLRWDPQRQQVMMRFPMGTCAWFTCQVTPQRHIINIKLLHSSGFPNYDRAVINAVRDLDGSSILKYPSRSRRPIVTQVAGIKTADQGARPDFRFGDVERYNVPAGRQNW